MAKDLNLTNEAAPAGIEADTKNREALQKLIDAWNSKNAKAGKRLGTFGFMAAALSACGSGGSGPSVAFAVNEQTGFKFLTGSLSSLSLEALDFDSFTDVTAASKDKVLDVSGLLGADEGPIDASGGMSVPDGQTFVADINLFDANDGGVAVSGAGSLWILAPATGFDANDEQTVRLNISLDGGRLTFDMPSDDYRINIDDSSTIDLDGGTLQISDGDVFVSAQNYASWNVGNLIVNSTLTIDLRGMAPSDQDVAKVLSELSAETDPDNPDSSVKFLVDDRAQAEMVFAALEGNTTLSASTAPKIEVEGADETSVVVDLKSVVDSKIEFLDQTLAKEIDALEQKLGGDITTNAASISQLQTDLTALEQLVADNDTAQAQALATKGARLEELITDLTATLNSEILRVEGLIGENADGIDDVAGDLATLQNVVTTLQGAAAGNNSELQANIDAVQENLDAAIGTLTNSLNGAIGDLEQKIQGEGVVEEDFTTLEALSAAITALGNKSSSSDIDLENKIGVEDDGEGNPTGLYLDIKNAVDAAVDALTKDINALQGQIDTNDGDIALLLDDSSVTADGNPSTNSIAGLKAALTSLSSAADTAVSSLEDAVGVPAGDRVEDIAFADGSFSVPAGSELAVIIDGEPVTSLASIFKMSTLSVTSKAAVGEAVASGEQVSIPATVLVDNFKGLPSDIMLMDGSYTVNVSKNGELSTITISSPLSSGPKAMYLSLGKFVGELASELEGLVDVELITEGPNAGGIELSLAGTPSEGDTLEVEAFTLAFNPESLVSFDVSTVENATVTYSEIDGTLTGEEDVQISASYVEDATGLHALIDSSVEGAIESLEESLSGYTRDGATGNLLIYPGDFASIKDLSDAVNKLQELAGLDELVGSGANATDFATRLADLETTTSQAIKDYVSQEIDTFEAQIQGFAESGDYTSFALILDDSSTNGGAPTTASIAGLKAALDQVSGGAVSDIADLQTAVGNPADPEADPAVEASGLYLEIEKAVKASVEALTQDITDLQGQIASNDGDIALILDDTNAPENTTGEPTTDSIAGLKAALDALSSTGTDVSDLQSDISDLEHDIADLQSQIDDIVAPDLIVRNELDNREELDTYDSEFIRVELGEGDDFVNASPAQTEIVGGQGADTINLTSKDVSQDNVIYQNVFDGKSNAIVQVDFSNDANDYRQGTVLTLTINGEENSYEVADGGQTPEDAIASFAQALSEQLVVDHSDALVGYNLSYENLSDIYDGPLGEEGTGEPTLVRQSDLNADGSYLVPEGMRFYPSSTTFSEFFGYEMFLIGGLTGGQTYNPQGAQVYDLSPIVDSDSHNSSNLLSEMRLIYGTEESIQRLIDGTADSDMPDMNISASDLLVRQESLLSGASADGSSLKLFGADSAELTVTGGGDATAAIENLGVVTKVDVSFSDDPADWPTQTNGDNTTVFGRKLSVTIDNETISDAVAYDANGDVDPSASVEALAKAVRTAAEATDGALHGVIGTATASGTTLTVEGAEVPSENSDAPTFSVDKAALETNGVQQQSTVAFSSDPADYYEGGELSVTVGGEPVTVSMTAGNPVKSVQDLRDAINAVAKYETTFNFNEDLSDKTDFDVAVNLTIDGDTVDKTLSDVTDIDDAISQLNAEFGATVQFAYDSELNQVVARSATEPTIVDGTSELVFGLPSAGSLVYQFDRAQTGGRAVELTDLMPLTRADNFSIHVGESSSSGTEYTSLAGAGTSETSFYHYTQAENVDPTVGNFFSWLESRDGVESVQVADDRYSVTVTASPGNNVYLKTVNFYTDAGDPTNINSEGSGGIIVGSNVYQQNLADLTGGDAPVPYASVDTSDLPLGVVESVEIREKREFVPSVDETIAFEVTVTDPTNNNAPKTLSYEFRIDPTTAVEATIDGEIFTRYRFLPEPTLKVDGEDVGIQVLLPQNSTQVFVKDGEIYGVYAALYGDPIETGYGINVRSSEIGWISSQTAPSIQLNNKSYDLSVAEADEAVASMNLSFDVSEIGLTFTAATEEPDPLQVEATLDYAGEVQTATISLEDDTSYTAFTDTTDVSASGRGADIYYENGKAYITIAPVDDPETADVDESVTNAVTVSADMVTVKPATLELDASGVQETDVLTSARELQVQALDGSFDVTLDILQGTDTIADVLQTVEALAPIKAASLVDEKIVVVAEDGIGQFSFKARVATIETEDTTIVSGERKSTAPADSEPGEYTSQALVDAINAQLEDQIAFSPLAGDNQTGNVIQVEVPVFDRLQDSIYSAIGGEVTFSVDDEDFEFHLFMSDGPGGATIRFRSADSEPGTDGLKPGLDDLGVGVLPLSQFSNFADKWNDLLSAYEEQKADGRELGEISFDKSTNTLTFQAADGVSVTAGGVTADETNAYWTYAPSMLLEFTVEGSDTAGQFNESIRILPDGATKIYNNSDLTSVPGPEAEVGTMVPGDLAAMLDNASYDSTTGEITLTAKEVGQKTFEVSDVSLDYEGVQQIATVKLDSNAVYDSLSDDGALTGRSADTLSEIYFENGKAYITIEEADAATTGETDVVDSKTVSVDMVNSYGVFQLTLPPGWDLDTPLADGTFSYLSIEFKDGANTVVETIDGEGGTLRDLVTALNFDVNVASASFTAETEENDPMLRLQLDEGSDVESIVADGSVKGSFGRQTISGSEPTSKALVDEINAQINGAVAQDPVLSALLDNATYDEDTGEIILTSKTTDKEMFKVADAALDYQGLKQIAEVEFSTNSSDYYTGGTATLEIDTTPGLDGGLVSFTGTTPSGSTNNATSTLEDLVANIQTGIDSGQLSGVVGAVELDSGTIRLTSADAVEQAFAISNAELSVLGQKQEATVGFSNDNGDYYAGGELSVSIKGQDQTDPFVISADMTAGDAEASVQALADKINAIGIDGDSELQALLSDIESAEVETNGGEVDLRLNAAERPEGSDSKTFDVSDATVNREAIKQVTEIDTTNVVFDELRADKNGNLPQTSITVAGETITTDAGTDGADTMRELAQRLIEARDGTFATEKATGVADTTSGPNAVLKVSADSALTVDTLLDYAMIKGQLVYKPGTADEKTFDLSYVPELAEAGVGTGSTVGDLITYIEGIGEGQFIADIVSGDLVISSDVSDIGGELSFDVQTGEFVETVVDIAAVSEPGQAAVEAEDATAAEVAIAFDLTDVNSISGYDIELSVDGGAAVKAVVDGLGGASLADVASSLNASGGVFDGDVTFAVDNDELVARTVDTGTSATLSLISADLVTDEGVITGFADPAQGQGSAGVEAEAAQLASVTLAEFAGLSADDTLEAGSYDFLVQVGGISYSTTITSPDAATNAAVTVDGLPTLIAAAENNSSNPLSSVVDVSFVAGEGLVLAIRDDAGLSENAELFVRGSQHASTDSFTFVDAPVAAIADAVGEVDYETSAVLTDAINAYNLDGEVTGVDVISVAGPAIEEFEANIQQGEYGLLAPTLNFEGAAGTYLFSKFLFASDVVTQPASSTDISDWVSALDEALTALEQAYGVELGTVSYDLEEQRIEIVAAEGFTISPEPFYPLLQLTSNMRSTDPEVTEQVTSLLSADGLETRVTVLNGQQFGPDTTTGKFNAQFLTKAYDAGNITLTAKDGGTDPMNVTGFETDVVSADSVAQVVNILFFGDGTIDSLEAGSVITIDLPDNQQVAYTVGTDTAGESAAADLSTFYAEKLLDQLADLPAVDAENSSVSTNIDGQTLITLRAAEPGPDNLGNVVGSEINVTVERNTGTEAQPDLSVASAAAVNETIAGQLVYETSDGGAIINDDNGEGSAVTGEDETTLSSANADPEAPEVDNTAVEGKSDDPVSQELKNPDNGSNQSFYGEEGGTQATQEYTNPDDGFVADEGTPEIDQTADAENGNAEFAGDPESTGEGNGVTQTHTNPDSGYDAVDASPEGGTTTGGDETLYGSEPGQYVDSGLETDYLSGGSDEISGEIEAYDLGGEVTEGNRITVNAFWADEFDAQSGSATDELGIISDFTFTTSEGTYEIAILFSTNSASFFDGDTKGSLSVQDLLPESGPITFADYVSGLNDLLTEFESTNAGGKDLGSVAYNSETKTLTWFAADGVTISAGNSFDRWLGESKLLLTYRTAEQDTGDSYYRYLDINPDGTAYQYIDNAESDSAGAEEQANAKIYTEGPTVYQTQDGNDLTDRVDVGDGSTEDDGGTAGTLPTEDTDSDTTDLSVTEDDAGVPAYTGDATVTDVFAGNAAADVITNFQVANDVIGIEGELAASTIGDDVFIDALIGDIERVTELSDIIFTAVDVDGTDPDDETGSVYFDALAWKVTTSVGEASDLLTSGLTLNGELSLGARSVDGESWLTSSAPQGAYADLNALVAELNEGSPQYTLKTIGDDVLLVLDTDTASRVSNGEQVVSGSVEQEFGLAFNLSNTEFGLVDSATSSLSATEIGTADNVASLLNSVFDFSGDTPNADINTTIFAITASDDASETAIWAHTQSSADDATVDALELNLLGTVETVGDGAGTEEFGIENFAVSNDAGGWDILSAEQQPIA